MRICLIGKFPPIQGGVSMRTYWSAHGLAALGHEVHVVTNAKEATAPFRMHMRTADWSRCEATYGNGSVTVHWTDPVDGSQSYIPMASPFVSKLAASAARAHSGHPFDVIFSFYMEPYAIAGHLAAQMTGAAHVVRMAGSDAGRLWPHPQFEPLYDHVLRSAEVVIAGGTVAERAIQRGVDPNRIVFGGGFVVPEDLFTPDGPSLDLATLRAEVQAAPDFRELLWGEFTADVPYFGLYGKIGESKGSFALLEAMDRLKHAGLKTGLVALAHGSPAIQRQFRAKAKELGLIDRILQIPFLPHWRVPEFLRGCAAVCCLEQDFPIKVHTPIIATEVLLSGTCLVASTEILRKLPAYGRLPHGYGCVAIEDVNDSEALSHRLAAMLRDPEPIETLGARGRAFALEMQRDVPFPRRLEQILLDAARGRKDRTRVSRAAGDAPAQVSESRFSLTRLALAAIDETNHNGIDTSISSDRPIDLGRARRVMAAVERAIGDGNTKLRRLVPAIRLEIALATAEIAAKATKGESSNPLFRLRIRRWAMTADDLAGLVPVRDPQLRIVEFDYDVAEFRNAQSIAELPEFPTPNRSYVIVFGNPTEAGREPLSIDATTAKILDLSDGKRTASDIINKINRHSDATPEVDD